MFNWKFGIKSTDDDERNASRQQATQSRSRANSEQQFASHDPSPGNAPPRMQRGPQSTRQADGFMAFMQRGASAADAEMERRVSVAARNLGDGVQKIVMAAKGSGRQGGGQQGEWKLQLLKLLGGSDEEQGGMFARSESNIDILLDNSNCEKFVLRCVENELPPNLIHCLRLLRVLELQHANAQHQRGEGATASISTRATSKVSKLLCLLCADSIVGDQLRPHLFGLLALSGASYPVSGVHVAAAASSVIVSFAENCLSSSLVWFLHDRKMIVHMTDDIKELCGMSTVSASVSASLCLYGDAAEEAGLWVIALKTVVNLVVHSCNFQCVELLKDFNNAGGYHVLCYAIANSSGPHAKKLLELVSTLACCKTDLSPVNTRQVDGVDDAIMMNDSSLSRTDQDSEKSKLATNPAAFDIVEDLMVRSVPLLKEFDQVYGGERPEITSQESLRELSTFSMRTALNVRFVGVSMPNPKEQSLAMELLVTTLQMYSDHAKNYDIIEERHSILSYYLLAFPTFDDVSLKVLILKTLEYVLTGVAGTDAIKPLTVASEIFFALCKSLLKGANGIELESDEESKIYEDLLMDAEMMGSTIEKLLEFDIRVAPIMIDGGILSVKLNEVLEFVMQVTDNIAKHDPHMFAADGKFFCQPPEKTALDRVFAAICRVLRLVVSKSGKFISESYEATEDASGLTNLNVLLVTAISQLGEEASAAALSVFESKISLETHQDLLRNDMEFILELLNHFAEMTGRLRGLDLLILKPKGKKSDVRVESDGVMQNNKKDSVHPYTIIREASIFQMLKSAMDDNYLAQDLFRLSGGFEACLRIFICLENVALDQEDKMPSTDGNPVDCRNAILKLIDASFGLLGSVTLSNPKRQGNAVGAIVSRSYTGDFLTDEISSHLFSTPSSVNRHFINRSGFYIDFSNAIAMTGILLSEDKAREVLRLSIAFIDPSLKSLFSLDSTPKEGEVIKKIQMLKNPDASRVLLGISVKLPINEFGMKLSIRALDEMLRLCSNDRVGSTLSQIASCGLCWTITSWKEFATPLDDPSHHLFSRFVLLLRRIAAFSMTYMDFVATLRCVAGPLLRAEKDVRIRLPVISSSIRTQISQQPSLEEMNSVAWQGKENDFFNRLTTLSIIAERGERVPRCEVGGDSLNTIAVYMHNIPIEERFQKMADEGRIKYMEIESLDVTALSTNGVNLAGSAAPSSNLGERIWIPLSTTGFSYSIWLRLAKPVPEGIACSLFLLDISSPTASTSKDYISFWYDVHDQRFSVLTSTSYRNEPTSFPVSPLRQGVWHHILLTYTPARRSMLSKKTSLCLFVDGRSLESDIKVESVNLPPNARVHIGVPNPHLAVSGHVRGSLPPWELGPTLMVASLLSTLDATSIYMSGPDFQGMFWGDRPQRLSLAATGTASFAMLAESGEQGSVAGALRRREIPRLEAAGTVIRESNLAHGTRQTADSDSLASLGLLSKISPEYIVFGFRAASSSSSRKGLFSRRLVNVARMNASKEDVASDAFLYGHASLVLPYCFADNIQWVGGPGILLPIINATISGRSLALALRLVRESVRRHPPNLEMLQAGGGYKMLAVLLSQKKIIDKTVLDECFAFAVHGFVPGPLNSPALDKNEDTFASTSWPSSDHWVFVDLDAMKYLLLNHQVWDMRSSGPEIPLRLLSMLNGLVAQKSAHKAFNSRRMHLLGIVKWTLHLLLEAAELFTMGEVVASIYGYETEGPSDNSKGQRDDSGSFVNPVAIAAYNNGWRCQAPAVESTAVGGDPGNPLLQACKTLLRRVLTFMLTPGDLAAIAEVAVFTVSINFNGQPGGQQGKGADADDSAKLYPGSVSRVYLLRLIEELIVDGVNEIVTSVLDNKGESDGPGEPSIQPHAGGGASTNQSYLANTMMLKGRRRPDGSEDPTHPKHTQAQAFLDAFAAVLSPIWFACILEGCNEEASASAVLRLMVLMLQSSSVFSSAFKTAGGFAPFVLSIPKFSTCPSIIMSMLAQLLHAPILHLPCFGVMDSTLLCEVFDAESSTSEVAMKGSVQSQLKDPTDPSSGIFALLAECLGRNIQLATFDNHLGKKARQTNEAVLQLLSHRHRFSSAFQEFCQTPNFLEPLAQALCLVHDEKLQLMQLQGQSNGFSVSDSFTTVSEQGTVKKMKRRGSLADVPKNETPTERFVGKPEEETGITGIGMVQLLRLVVSHAVISGPLAAPLVSALFRSFPIHASPEQVEAFHLVLIEHCKSVVEDALQRGDPVALANCIGVSSVLLDRLMAGFFTSEPVLEATNIIISTLSCLATSGTYASRALGNAEQNMLTADAAHLARLTCLTGLRRSRPIGHFDEGDEDLKSVVLEAISVNIQSLLLVPVGGGPSPRRQGTMNGNPNFPTPPASSRMFPLWQSASLARCYGAIGQCTYPDLSLMEEPDRAFVVALLDEVYYLLFDPRDDLKDTAVSIVVSLLQQRRNIMSELLIAEVHRGDRIETIDIMSRGGFGALLFAHEAATYAENISTVPRRVGNSSASKKKYATFFEWLDRHQQQVEAVFGNIHAYSIKLLPGLEMGVATPEDAIENEQKSMLLRLTSQDSSDCTIRGGLDRAKLAQSCYDETSENHLLWKRQGFDDLSSGGLQWKILLRQLKGSCSIWEGGTWTDEESQFSKKRLLQSLSKKEKDDLSRKQSFVDSGNEKKAMSNELVTKWKLDLTEGYEGQRRRLLPNYEWYALYGLKEGDSDEEDEEKDDDDSFDSGLLADIATKFAGKNTAHLEQDKRRSSDFFLTAESLREAAALLNKLKVKKKSEREGDRDTDDFFDDDEENDNDGTTTVSTSMESDTAPHDDNTVLDSRVRSTSQGANEVQADATPTDSIAKDRKDSEVSQRDQFNASSYDLITGLLNPGDWPEQSYNVQRCMGLEVVKALLLWCRNAIYIIDGFELTEGKGLEGKIERVQKEQSTFDINVRSKKGRDKGKDETNKGREADQDDSEVTFQHRSQRISFTELYSVFQRRYQLQNVALEFFDIHRCATLVAFNTHGEREEVLAKVLSSPLPNSIFNSSYGTSINYKKFMNTWKTKIISQWVNGKMTNFELLMHINSFAGRSYNDLTQYPVFPWVIADYTSDELDLQNPRTFRDLTKPMGAQTEARAQQFREKYREYEEGGMEPAHYGTHYSCAAYVLYYLMRLEPFSRLALRLQGGRFDVADRLFYNLGSSWKSASAENQQDVRELIPEFFFLPEFLENKNEFDFGITQTGNVINDVTLPKWAKGSPERFIRLHRQALESDYVSKNLNHWIDLVFGYKQRGREAIAALNVFPHYSYEGNIDIDGFDDPILRESAIQSAQNFGQTPKCIERKPFVQRVVVSILRDKNLDFGALTYLVVLTPPFCIVGAPQRIHVRPTAIDTCKLGIVGQSDPSVGDLCLVKGQLIGVGRTCALIMSQKKYYRFGGPNNGVSVHVAATSTRYRELNKMLSIHDCMHRAPISCAKASINGLWLVTGSVDSTVRVWRYDGNTMELRATLCGHEGGYITCIDISTAFGTIVTGCSNGHVLLWDLRTLTFMRKLRFPFVEDAMKDPHVTSMHSVISVSLNHKNGNVVTLVGPHLSCFDINAKLLASLSPGGEYAFHNRPTRAVATDCPEWMEHGIVAITGHITGDILLWGIDMDKRRWKLRHVLTDNPHSEAITALRVEASNDRQDTLLIGDKSGKISVCKTLSLDQLTQMELTNVTEEIRAGIKESSVVMNKKSISTETHNWMGYMTGND